MGKIVRLINGICKQGLPYAISTRLYPPGVVSEGEPPVLYNSYGERVLVAYLRDDHISHSPYTMVSGRIPRRIFWDHYNNGLKNHFYNEKAIFNRYPKIKDVKHFCIVLEPENIIPKDYDNLVTSTDVVRDLDALFTHSERLLDKYDNACFIPASGVWYGTELHGGVIEDNKYLKKEKLISMVCSTKTLCSEHVFRKELAKELIRTKKADVKGQIVGNYVDDLDEVYGSYMYNIAIENTKAKYYFTEKILNCFASMTVPVYYGAIDIGSYFNKDGIICIDEPNVESALSVINSFCTPEDYESRREAIIENYNRVQKYLCVEDFIINSYIDKFVF